MFFVSKMKTFVAFEDSIFAQLAPPSLFTGTERFLHRKIFLKKCPDILKIDSKQDMLTERNLSESMIRKILKEYLGKPRPRK